MHFRLHFLFIIVLFINSYTFAICTSGDLLRTSCSVAECINGGHSDLLSAILCNGCLRKVLSNTDADVSPFHGVIQQFTDDHSNGWRKVHDTSHVNMNILHLIADQLEINDMLSLFEALPSKRFSAVINDIFRNKYRNHIVYIDGRFDLDDVKFEENSKRIVVDRKAAIFLKAFGSSIQQLEIEHPSTITLQCIDKYVSDSLTKLELVGINENPFKYFKKPFNVLEELSLHSSVTIGNGHLPLNQLFPKIQRLELWPNSAMNKSVVACAFPHLRYLQLNVKHAQNDEMFLGVIIENPHIQSIQIDHLSQVYCKIIIEHVVCLENLTISYCDIGDGACFEHVKHLKIGRNPGNYERLSIPRLQSLSMIGHADSMLIKWNDFVSKHPNISLLKLSNFKDAVGHASHMTLTELVNGLSNLIELIVDHPKTDIKAEIIVELIEKNAKLESLGCISCFFSEEDVNGLSDKLENDWHLFVRHVDERMDLLFEKKKEIRLTEY